VTPIGAECVASASRIGVLTLGALAPAPGKYYRQYCCATVIFQQTRRSESSLTLCCVHVPNRDSRPGAGHFAETLS